MYIYKVIILVVNEVLSKLKTFAELNTANYYAQVYPKRTTCKNVAIHSAIR